MPKNGWYAILNLTHYRILKGSLQCMSPKRQDDFVRTIILTIALLMIFFGIMMKLHLI